MRRICIFILLTLLLTTAVSAAGSVDHLESTTQVYSNGKSEVTMTVQFSLDEVPGKLLFPLPREARNISLNGGSARTSVSGDVRNVDLSGYIHSSGSHTFVLRYDLPDGVTSEKSGLVFTLKLLSGFAYPIDSMDFSITLPGAPEHRAEFVSTYHQETVDSLMEYAVDGNTIHCSFTQGLKDHESLTMTLAVSEELFPQPISKKWSLSTDDILMYFCMLAALLYWIFFMRTLPPRRLRRTQPPVGMSAGELGCCLTGQGVDFTMLVLSWAQMGYVMLQVDDNGRVLIHKRMEMGNERSEFENRLFRNLFARRSIVDGTGHHFAALSMKAAKTIPNARDYFLPQSGNPTIFRCICALIGILGGVSLALSFVTDTAWQVILGILLGALGAVLSWQIHTGTAVIHLRNKLPLAIAGGGSLLWLLLGIWAGEWGVALLTLVCQWLGGLAVAYGGRRSETGRQTMADILGLRRYLRSLSTQELQQILHSNPDYFYQIAPYALALGVEKPFIRLMGKRKLPPCSYLTTGMDGHLTAREWGALLHSAVQTLDERQKTLALRRFLGW